MIQKYKPRMIIGSILCETLLSFKYVLITGLDKLEIFTPSIWIYIITAMIALAGFIIDFPVYLASSKNFRYSANVFGAFKKKRIN